ncbi:survival protein sure-like phosphatase/nucleotidase [Xylariomycetidae sp. FL0641]|nr:survival protein sure-like phosphatase/nucleotidase [Xylariomycetidae sp. FL0641]
MHILVTNDDGPPSTVSSPYVHRLVRELQKAGHVVSVCLPHAQRSWIGKAHMIGQTVKPLYYRPSADFDPRESAAHLTQGTTHPRPTTRRHGGSGRDDNNSNNNDNNSSSDETDEEWILVDGTPASCAQIGLHHFFQERGPVDLVVSGPNYGRNTTALFALSSGTLGAALEAAVCRRRAVALSFAFFSRNHDPEIIGGAARHAVRVLERLAAAWPDDGSVDLYTVNVPLVEGVEDHKTFFVPMLQNYWGTGSGGEGACFEEVEGSVADQDEEEERIREGEEAGDAGDKGKETPGAYTHRHFRWKPRWTDVYKSVEDAGPGNDGWTVKEGCTSVTPMKANFWHSATHLHGTELTL